MPTAACSRTARRLFWYLLACAIGVVLVRWLQSLEGIGMMWVFLSAVSRQQPTAVPRHVAAGTAVWPWRGYCRFCMRMLRLVRGSRL